MDPDSSKPTIKRYFEDKLGKFGHGLHIIIIIFLDMDYILNDLTK